MRLIGAIGVLGSILMSVTVTMVPGELGLDPNQQITIYVVAVAIGLAGFWLLLRKQPGT